MFCRRFLFAPLLILSSCSSPRPAREPERLPTYSAEHNFGFQGQPQCKEMFDSYCHYLYSPEALGNLEIKRAQSTLQILQGETSNQFSQVFFRYAQAKLRNQGFLPRDFYQSLQGRNYFSKLKAFIDRRPRDEMNLSLRLQSEQLDYEIGSSWSAALNEIVIQRVEKKYPGFHRMPDKMVPLELSLEKRRTRRSLISEVSQAVWRDDKNWKKVETGFEKLKSSYVRMISKLDIPQGIQTDWINRIQQVRLVLPGSMPSISDEECSTTTINAYYYRYLNVITVCAGDFNSEDIIQTLAHEMGHAIGIDRTQYLFENQSEFGTGLRALRGQVCQPKQFSCSAWQTFKQSFDQKLTSLKTYQPELPEFQRCLKTRATANSLNDDAVSRIARIAVSDRMSELASADRFLRITKPRIPLRNGKLQKNPNYLNPCSYYLWSHGEEPIDDELTTLVFFTAEYRCNAGEPMDRLKQAIEISKDMSRKVIENTLRIEGEFSPNNQLEKEGFSSPPFERFADVLGSYAMAELMREIPDQWERRNKFLASSSWQCVEPSIASHFPEESNIERQYIFDEHSEGDERRKEIFTTPIRDVIGCQKDFEFKECSLPFKKQ
jgi:hypothetical protein